MMPFRYCEEAEQSEADVAISTVNWEVTSSEHCAGTPRIDDFCEA